MFVPRLPGIVLILTVGLDFPISIVIFPILKNQDVQTEGETEYSPFLDPCFCKPDEIIFLVYA